jgi:glycosyltransferase involved in cell wall biosynthesis
MIVKDEETVLEKCLEAIKKYGYEIVIVDTGSKDRTKEIAYKYTDKVFDFQWCNDFSLARNFSISKADNEYILVIDSDEIVTSLNTKAIDSLLKKNRNKVGRLLRVNEYSRKGIKYKYRERVNRLFSRKYYKYEGSIHEQLIAIDNSKVETYLIPLEMNHYGYEEEELIRKSKIKRNIDMLKNELSNNMKDPYILYQLGKSFYMGENYIEACDYFNKALEIDLDIKLEYVQDLVESYGYSLINSQQYEESMKLLNVYDEFKDSADFIFVIALIYMNNSMFNEAIYQFKKAKLIKECKMDGVNTYLSNYNIGVILECLGDKEAKKYYKLCGKYEPAILRLKSIM